MEQEETCIKTLIIESAEVLASNIIKELQGRLPVGECDFSPTLFKGVKSLLEEAYDLCLISDAFPLPELEVFFRDVTGSVQSKGCVFVLVKDKLAKEFDRSSLAEFGFQTVVTRNLANADIEVITKLLAGKLHACEVKRRVIDVDKALQIAFKEIDAMAADIKRGAKRDINTLSMDFINLQADFDQEILDEYLTKLVEKTEGAETPVLNTKLEIPAQILARNLPKLSKDTYTGASRRVWKVLVDMHGQNTPKKSKQVKGAEAPQGEDPSSAAVPTEAKASENPKE